MDKEEKKSKIVESRIVDKEWDYYSGLPNPMWYENKDNEVEKER